MVTLSDITYPDWHALLAPISDVANIIQFRISPIREHSRTVHLRN